jgi:hypothetical protein
MLKTLHSKPYLLFSVTGIISLLVSAYYYFCLPDSSFDISVRKYFEINSAVAWLTLSGYNFLLAAIYFITAKRELHTRNWLVITHFVFVILFLLVFFAFSSFNAPYAREIVSGMPFLTLVVLYGMVFLTDVIFFITGIALLVVNILTMKKD